MDEGAPLLRAYRVYPLSRVRIPLSPPVFFFKCALVAQLDRALGYELRGREFESLRAHHLYGGRFTEGSSSYLDGPFFVSGRQIAFGTVMGQFRDSDFDGSDDPIRKMTS